MYWGNAPQHLQKGFPKFDGKDFYPPSPVKDGSSGSEAVASSSDPQLCNAKGITQGEYGSFKGKAESDSLGTGTDGQAGQRLTRGSLTQSETLPRVESSTSLTPATIKNYSGLSCTQTGRSYDDFRRALGESTQASSSGCKGKSSPDSGDDSNILFKGRRYMSINNKYVCLHHMLFFPHFTD